MSCPPRPSVTETLRAKLQQIEGSGPAKQRPEAHLPTLNEVFVTMPTDAAGPGFVMAHLPQDLDKPVLWIQDSMSQRESGRPYLAGLAKPPQLLCLTVTRAVDVLWAMEQGLGCTDLGAVVAEVWGDAPAVDFTATKRLALRAEAHAVPAWLLRRAAAPNLSAARTRWRLGSAPSAPAPFNPRAPGAARWEVELFRARGQTPGRWIASYDRASHQMQFDTAAPAKQPTPLAHRMG